MLSLQLAAPPAHLQPHSPLRKVAPVQAPLLGVRHSLQPQPPLQHSRALRQSPLLQQPQQQTQRLALTATGVTTAAQAAVVQGVAVQEGLRRKELQMGVVCQQGLVLQQQQQVCLPLQPQLASRLACSCLAHMAAATDSCTQVCTLLLT